MHRAGRGRRWDAGLSALAVVGLLAAGALTACGDDDTRSEHPADEATTTTLSPEDEVEAAYLAFWDMFVRLAQAPDPSDEEIAQRASGETLQMLIDSLVLLQRLNRRSEFGPGYVHEVVSITLQDEGTAIVTDCAVDDSRIVDSETGQAIEEGVVTELSEVTLVRGATDWLVDHSTRLYAWEGTVECAEYLGS